MTCVHKGGRHTGGAVGLLVPLPFPDISKQYLPILTLPVNRTVIVLDIVTVTSKIIQQQRINDGGQGPT